MESLNLGGESGLGAAWAGFVLAAVSLVAVYQLKFVDPEATERSCQSRNGWFEDGP